MIPGFVIRRSTLADLEALDDLLVLGRLVKSGPPDSFTLTAAKLWVNPDVTLSLVACPEGDLKRVVSHAQLCHKATKSRSRAELEDVATHPDYLRRGLSSALLGRLIWSAQHDWGVGRIEWISEDIPDRTDARRFYLEVVGARLVDGTDSCFRLNLPYQASDYMRPHFVNPFP